MRWVAITTVTALALAGCNTTSQDDVTRERAVPTTISASEMKSAQEQFAKQMKDPSAAQFGQTNVGSLPGGRLLFCGWVNGKNSFGGYNGMSPFIATYSPDTKSVDMAIESSKYNIIERFCRDKGLSIPPSP